MKGREIVFCNEEELPAVMSFEEVREYLYIGRNTLLKLLHKGEIKGFRVGKKWRIRKEDLLDYTIRG